MEKKADTYVLACRYVAAEDTKLVDLQALNQRITQRLTEASWSVELPSDAKEVVEKIRAQWIEIATETIFNDEELSPELLLLEKLLRLIPAT